MNKMIKSYSEAITAARELRKNQTAAEKKLWTELRAKRLNGIKFVRQHPLHYDFEGKGRFFIADFYCAEAKLVIELDGKIHEQQQEYDAIRTSILEGSGFKVIRFTNDSTMNNLQDTLKTILAALHQ